MDNIFTTRPIVKNDNVLSGGLNSSSGPLGLQDSESSDLQNIDFNKYGSILKRNGYATLNSSAITTDEIGGLYWYEYNSSGSTVRKMITLAGSAIYKMDDLDGTWDDISGSNSVTIDEHTCFSTFLNEVYITTGSMNTAKWTGTGNFSFVTMPTNVTNPKYNAVFNNYLFIANVLVSTVKNGSRIYWSNLKSTSTWTATDFIDIAKDDGQEITGIKVLQDRLVIFKERSIYNLFFTGDADIPFVLPGGGKSNSAVGCVAPWSIQEINNGLVFLSYDGFYYYDGVNSYKISDRITTTLDGYNKSLFVGARSMVQKDKNRYFCSLPNTGSTENDRVIVWDFFNNAFSVYTGIAASAMTSIYVSGTQERVYFGDYDGYVYRMDTGSNDNPAGVETAIDAYYYTNWRAFSDLVIKKAPIHAVIYHQLNSATLTFSYSYSFESGDQYSIQFDTTPIGDVYGVAAYGASEYSGQGGAEKRLDLTSRGRVVRFKFSNSNVDETFQIDGFGTYVMGETSK